MDEENQHGPDCTSGDDEHRFTLDVRYMMTDDDGGDSDVTAAEIHSHIHGVPPMTVAKTLLFMAQNIAMQALAHSIFEDCPDEDLKHAMAGAAATVYIRKMLDELPSMATVINFAVPNDLSELLGEE